MCNINNLPQAYALNLENTLFFHANQSTHWQCLFFFCLLIQSNVNINICIHIHKWWEETSTYREILFEHSTLLCEHTPFSRTFSHRSRLVSDQIWHHWGLILTAKKKKKNMVTKSNRKWGTFYMFRMWAHRAKWCPQIEFSVQKMSLWLAIPLTPLTTWTPSLIWFSFSSSIFWTSR